MTVSNPGVCLTWPDHLISPDLVFFRNVEDQIRWTSMVLMQILNNVNILVL